MNNLGTLAPNLKTFWWISTLRCEVWHIQRRHDQRSDARTAFDLADFCYGQRLRRPDCSLRSRAVSVRHPHGLTMLLRETSFAGDTDRNLEGISAGFITFGFVLVFAIFVHAGTFRASIGHVRKGRRVHGWRRALAGWASRGGRRRERRCWYSVATGVPRRKVRRSKEKGTSEMLAGSLNTGVRRCWRSAMLHGCCMKKQKCPLPPSQSVEKKKRVTRPLYTLCTCLPHSHDCRGCLAVKPR